MNKAQKIATIIVFIIRLLYASAMCNRLKYLCPLLLSFLAERHHFSNSFTGIFDRAVSFDSAPNPF
jgi:hypothetical protein